MRGRHAGASADPLTLWPNRPALISGVARVKNRREDSAFAVFRPVPASTISPARFSTPVEPRTSSRRPCRWLGLLGSLVLRLLALTLRIEVEDPEALRARVESGPFILLFWHNRLLLVPVVWNRHFARHRPKGVALTSTSRDGGLIAEFLDRFGIGQVRGSATRRGSAALRELAGWLRRGHDVAITPDGSRGPCYELKPGPVLLAQLTGLPLLPISFEYTRAWRLRSWDRFFVPKPFSRVTLRVGEPYSVRRTAGAEDFEAERRRCEEILTRLVREA